MYLNNGALCSIKYLLIIISNYILILSKNILINVLNIK
jgi:hypothetical protein